MSIYVDTSAFIALLVKEDVSNASARPFWDELLDSQERLVTSNYVVVEACALLHRRFGISAVRQLVGELLPIVLVAWVDAELHTTGISSVLVSGRRGPGLVDCVSFATMRRLGIKRAFTFDSHFAEQGFEVCPAQG